ncbi:hypothetical protein DHEL01_v210919 [Diaporthe helianthi]|uniref:Heterokaryon incompatibility domain-containing protein n=1 Tax=Diaporthe helianthi TaxID=158607 RepID=A0A2P5HKB5_DIAHE|nr:hypothetical protein DHEL01_v210919 [Diaporthe helianthi]
MSTLLGQRGPSLKAYPAPVRNEHFRFNDVALQEYPYYLWDAIEQQTKQVHSLSGCPNYTCVSHTWGRWRKSSSAIIPGVEWPVPENTLYDVVLLPQWLSRLGDLYGTRYVWFDLFCIPQVSEEERLCAKREVAGFEDDDQTSLDQSVTQERLARLAAASQSMTWFDRGQIEISRQSAIFRNSERCIAWLNHCEDFTGVQYALSWLGLKYLESTTRRGGPNESCIDWETLCRELSRKRILSNHPVEFLEPCQHLSTLIPVGWFTSLWTLQEAVLCPDILICSRNWDTLSDNSGTPITLRTLMVILWAMSTLCRPQKPINFPFHDFNDYFRAVQEQVAMDQHLHEQGDIAVFEPFPSGVTQLLSLVPLTRLNEVLTTMLPMDILTNANMRTYTGNRAPAIMSAIGATDWFLEYESSGQHMVLSMFPLPFIQEAAKKIDGSFFEGEVKVSRILAIWHSVSTHPPQDHAVPRGSMLPFAEDTIHADSFDFAVHKVLLVDHPTVCQWEIHHDGTVSISSAGIFASSQQRGFSGGGATMEVSNWLSWVDVDDMDSDDRKHLTTADWPAQIRLLAKTGCVYAVALWSELGGHTGILLQRVRAASSDGAEILVKIGNYRAGSGMPAGQAVNWLVL